MTRWMLVGGLIIALVALLVLQQRRLDRLEDAMKRAAVAPPLAAPAEGTVANLGGEVPAGNRVPQVKFVPVPVPVPTAGPGAGAGVAPGTAASAGPNAPVEPVNPAFLNRAPLAERLAQLPARPVMG